MSNYQILLTNDDGIKSPGLWAAAEALSELGYVTVVAPRDQASGMGRSMPVTSDGIIHEERLQIKEQDWPVYAVGGTPAQAVQHGILEVMSKKPDLVVSGINYGSNLGTGITISGTVGAAMEAAAQGFRSLAVSLETAQEHHLSYSQEIDFSAAAHFTLKFARFLMENSPFPDVDLLKVDVPEGATPETAWEWTRLARQRYYDPVAPERESWTVPGTMGYKEAEPPKEEPSDSDVFVIRNKRLVSVTPITLDMTSKVDFSELERHFKSK